MFERIWGRDWHIKVVHSASEAQRALQHYPKFRLACVDLGIPGDGAHLIRWIKEHHPSVPVAVITGRIHDERTYSQVMDCGALFWFKKPFTSDDLRILNNFMDITSAIWKSRKPENSWRTTVCGAVLLGCGIYSMLTKPDMMTALGMIFGGVGLICGLDAAALKWPKGKKDKE